MKKRCSGCQHFIKFKNDPISSGLCHLQDGRCNSDFSCDLWKAIGYNRKKINKKKIENEESE